MTGAGKNDHRGDGISPSGGGPALRVEGGYAEYLDALPVGLCLVGPDGRIVQGNAHLAGLLRYDGAQSLIGVVLSALFVDAGVRDRWLAPEPGERKVEARIRRRDGSATWVEILSGTIRGVNGEPIGTEVCMADIADRRRTEDALRKSERTYRMLLENLPQRVFYKDRTLNYVNCNASYAADLHIGPEQIAGKSDLDFFTPEQAEQYRAADRDVMESGISLEFEESYGLDGQEYVHTVRSPVRDEAGEIIGILGVLWDITERIAAERETQQLAQQLRQAQKMEAIGRLAGGVAHDFNNQLTVIRGYCDMLLIALRPGDAAEASLREIQKAAERSADLTRKLLAFGRKQMLQPEVVNPHRILSEIQATLSRILGEEIVLSIVSDSGVGCVKIDRSQLEQAVMNLSINSHDAMPDGGMLTLKLSNVSLPAGDSRLSPDAKPGRYVLLEATDTGKGMDAQVIRQIFDPFFTTKAPGKGTGLGLSMVYGFVAQSGGRITVESSVGEGSTFRIYLPTTTEPEGTTDDHAAAAPPARGSETILVAEDDDTVRKFMVRMLGHLGYTVLEAAGAEEALGLAEKHVGEIDLLISDVVMPVMRGPQLAAKLKEDDPDLPVLFVSGYTEEAGLRKGPRPADAAFLAKPFGSEALELAVRELLAAAGDRRKS